MPQDYLPYVIQAVAGAVGGNVVGALRRNRSVGPLLNTLLGAAGGVGAAYAIEAGGYGDQVSALTGGNANIAWGVEGLGGGLVLPLIASLFKRGS